MTFELNSPLELLLACVLMASLPLGFIVLMFLAVRHRFRIAREAGAELQSEAYRKYFRGPSKTAFRRSVKFIFLALCLFASFGVLAALWVIWKRLDFENWILIALVLISLSLGVLAAAFTLRFALRNLTNGTYEQGEGHK
ncbi:MAG: hypothetical protein AB1564_11805 [Chloroflexota bacterium]